MDDDRNAVGSPLRIAAVHQSGLLDAAARPTLDPIIQLIRTVCRVPVALVSLVDEDRQIFASHSGLPEPYAARGQTPLSHSFCQHVVVANTPLVIADARTHDLLKTNLAIPDIGVVAYLGVPIVDPDGYVLGSLCAIDGVPRQWTADDFTLMKTLAIQVASGLQLRRQSTRMAAKLAEQQAIETDRQQLARLNVHDLRTPLTAMLMAMDLMQQLGTLDATQADFLAIARRNGTTLVNLANNLIDIGSVDHRGALALTRRPCDASALIHAAVRQVEPLARDKRIVVRVEIDPGVPPVPADCEKIERVLVNLLANAVKFTPDGGRVTARAAGRDIVRFTVDDTGIGMTDAARVFDEGVRLEEGPFVKHSTGLGLTFCKRIVEAHGGRIWCDTRPGDGTAFHFTLPQADA